MEQFAQQLNEVGETLLFMPRCYFLKTNESVSGMSIYNKLKSVLKDEDLFVLAPVKVADMNGWLATSSVTWLSNNKNYFMTIVGTRNNHILSTKQ